jgi:hypothetical protein
VPSTPFVSLDTPPGDRIQHWWIKTAQLRCCTSPITTSERHMMLSFRKMGFETSANGGNKSAFEGETSQAKSLAAGPACPAWR